MSADLLRQAAAKLREHANVASRGPWFAVERTGTFPHELVVAVERRWPPGTDPEDPGHDDVFVLPVDTGGFQYPAAEAIADTKYAALMHPPVALALADWLDETANHITEFAAVPGLVRTDDLTEVDNAALAAARAILREEES